jgi:peptidyl-prolyl cis-trans isomerase A (cyclophilin A)
MKFFCLLLAMFVIAGCGGGGGESSTVQNPQVTIVTTKGTIVVELNPAKAPITVNNFLTYVNEGFYGNTIFHRVVPGFVVQGGGFSTTGAQKTPHAAIALEPPSVTGLTNAAGTIVMARVTYDEANPLESRSLNSATSQFFINTVKNTNLDTLSGGYAVFGSVVSGMDVVKLIESAPITDPSKASSFVSVTSMTQTR